MVFKNIIIFRSLSSKIPYKYSWRDVISSAGDAIRALYVPAEYNRPINNVMRLLKTVEESCRSGHILKYDICRS